MAAKTLLSPTDISEILSDYAIGRYYHSEPISQGSVQTNYLIGTDLSRAVLRLYECRSLESVCFESELLTFLEERAYPSPRQIRNRKGDSIGVFQGKPFILFKWVEGQSVENPTFTHWNQLISKAAELHTLTQGYTSPWAPHRLNYTPEACEYHATEQASKIDTPAGYAKLEWLKRTLTSLHLPASLPQGACHGDFHFSNVFFEGDHFMALLDFDDANITYLLFDLVGLIEYWAWHYTQEKIDMERARGVVQEYHKHRPLSALEYTHLFDVYKLSILFDCVWYFGRNEGDTFYERRKIETLERIGRDAFLRALMPGG
jgi:Ser/Thr protein kinase RdoA (MazF antagonist)